MNRNKETTFSALFRWHPTKEILVPLISGLLVQSQVVSKILYPQVRAPILALSIALTVVRVGSGQEANQGKRDMEVPGE
jgi:hypothetical protein